MMSEQCRKVLLLSDTPAWSDKPLSESWGWSGETSTPGIPLTGAWGAVWGVAVINWPIIRVINLIGPVIGLNTSCWLQSWSWAITRFSFLPSNILINYYCHCRTPVLVLKSSLKMWNISSQLPSALATISCIKTQQFSIRVWSVVSVYCDISHVHKADAPWSAPVSSASYYLSLQTTCTLIRN